MQLGPGPPPPGPAGQASFCSRPGPAPASPGADGDPRTACLPAPGRQGERPPYSHFSLSQHISCWSCFFLFVAWPLLTPFLGDICGDGGGGRAHETWLLNHTPPERWQEGGAEAGWQGGQGVERDPVRGAQSCGPGGGTLGTMWLCVDVSVRDCLVSRLCVQSSAGAPLLWFSVMSR